MTASKGRGEDGTLGVEDVTAGRKTKIGEKKVVTDKTTLQHENWDQNQDKEKRNR